MNDPSQVALVPETVPRGQRIIRFTFTDIFGIERGRLEIRSGEVTKLVGANGAGKTSAARAMYRALGGDIDVEVRDGAAIGVIDAELLDPAGGESQKLHMVVPPATSRKGRVRTTGEVPITATDGKLLAQLITGGHGKTPETRAERRLDAFNQLLRVTLSPADISLLCEHDEEMIGWLSERVTAGTITDLPAAEKALKLELQRRAREHEDAAKGFEGQVSAAKEAVANQSLRLEKLGYTEPIQAPNVAGAQADVEAAVRHHDQVKKSADARREKEGEREQIRAASTARPDVAAAEARTRALAADFNRENLAHGEKEREISQLEATLLAARQELAAIAGRRDQAKTRGKAEEVEWRRLEGEADRWDAQQALLTAVITGSTDDEVAAADQAIVKARLQEDVHRASADMRAAQVNGEQASQRQGKEADRGKQLRDWSNAVSDRVADVLARQGSAGFTVLDGRLAVRLEDGAPLLDFEDRLSSGQRFSCSFRLASQLFRGFVYLDPEFYSALDFEHQREIDEWAAAHLDVFLCTEVATEGPLGVAGSQPDLNEAGGAA